LPRGSFPEIQRNENQQPSPVKIACCAGRRCTSKRNGRLNLLFIYTFCCFCISLCLCFALSLECSFPPWNKLGKFVFENTKYWVMKQVLSTKLCVCVDQHKLSLCFQNVPDIGTIQSRSLMEPAKPATAVVACPARPQS
jgi:hypothetical protein